MSIESVMPSNHFILCCPLYQDNESRLQSFPASGSFQMSQFLTSGSQSIGVSTSASVLPMNIQDWFPLGWTGWISLQSKGLSRVFSNTTVKKHQFFSAQLSLWSNFHIHTKIKIKKTFSKSKMLWFYDQTWRLALKEIAQFLITYAWLLNVKYKWKCWKC